MAVVVDFVLNDDMTSEIQKIINSTDELLDSLKKVSKESDDIIDIGSVKKADDKIDKLTRSIRNLDNKLKTVKETSNNTFNSMVLGIGKTMISMFAVSKLVQGAKFTMNIADEYMRTSARLDLIKDGLQTTDELWDDISDTANRVKAPIMEMASFIARVALTTGDLFESNAEILRLSEIVNKSFKISGTSISNANSATLQLVQALGAGVLRGDELNSIFENAPLLVGYISDYIDVPIGKIRDLASEGKITSEIVKDAILNAADEVNEQFGSISETFSGRWTQAMNIATENFKPFLNEVSKLPQALGDSISWWDTFTFTVSSSLISLTSDITAFGRALRNSFTLKEESEKEATISQKQDYYREKYNVEFSKQDISKIDSIANTSTFENLVKGTGNAIANVADIAVGAANWAGSSISSVVGNLIGNERIIENAAKGLRDAEEQIMGSQNYTNNPYFGTTLGSDEFEETVIEKVIDMGLGEKLTSSPELPPSMIKDVIKPKKTFDFNSIGNKTDKINNKLRKIERNTKKTSDLQTVLVNIQEAMYTKRQISQFNGNIEIVTHGVLDEKTRTEQAENVASVVRDIVYGDFSDAIALGGV